MIPGLIIWDRMWPVARLATASSFFFLGGGFNAVFLRCESAEMAPRNLLSALPHNIASYAMCQQTASAN